MLSFHEFIIKCRRGTGGTVSYAAVSWQSPGRSSRGQASEKSGPFSIWTANKQLKIEEN